MPSTAFALNRVLEHALSVMEGSRNPTLGTSVMNKWTFGLQFHRFATLRHFCSKTSVGVPFFAQMRALRTQDRETRL